MKENHHLHSGSTGDPEFDKRIQDLVADWGGGIDLQLVQEMIVTALKMAHDPVPLADMKLFNRALKEMRKATNVFSQYGDRRKVAVFGSARTLPDQPDYQAAVEFSKRLVQAGYMIITGGGDGIMGAAQLGAGREHSFGLNIRLPFEQHANKTIQGDPKLINFNYFFTRKLNFLKETHAVALFPGGFGTMDEGFETLTLMQTGKARIMPLVFVDRPGGHYWSSWRHFLQEFLLKYGLISEDDFYLFRLTEDVEEAVREITHFYSCFHSYRWVGQRMVIRLTQQLKPSALQALNNEFAGDLERGCIEQTTALPEEANEPALSAMPRLVLSPKRHNFGRLRLMIDRINDLAECEASEHDQRLSESAIASAGSGYRKL